MFFMTAKKSAILSIFLITGLILSSTHQVLAKNESAKGEISEEQLDTEKALGWGGEGLPFDASLTIRDPLVNSIVGKVTIDRHGEDDSSRSDRGLLGLFDVRAPFAGPFPGRLTVVTFWGSKEEGCFVKASIHNAPKGKSKDAPGLVPVKMEVGIGPQVVKLTPAAKSVPKTASSEYKYTVPADNNNSNTYSTVEKLAMLYFTENTFAINAKSADLLRNAPKGNAKVRLTFANGNTKIFPISEKNVARWKDAYSYNPNCTAAK
jgi:hypothetical protein